MSDKTTCPKCKNPNIGTIKDGSEVFLKKHKNQKGELCLGSFSKVGNG